MANQNISNLAGQIIGNIVGQYLSILQHEMRKSKSYKEALQAVKSGQLSKENINLPQEAPVEVPELVQNLLKAVVTGYLPMIESESEKTQEYYGMLGQIKQGKLDPQSLVVTDDGVRIVPVLAPEEDDDEEEKPKNNRRNGKATIPTPEEVLAEVKEVVEEGEA